MHKREQTELERKPIVLKYNYEIYIGIYDKIMIQQYMSFSVNPFNNKVNELTNLEL